MHKYLKNIFVGSAILFFLALLWFSFNFLQLIDQQIFRFLNNSLEINHYFAFYWMLLNHKSETFLNVLLMLSIHILIIYQSKSRSESLVKILIYWFCLEIFIYGQHVLYHNVFDITRLSPSLVFDDTIRLTKMFPYNIKDSSTSSFPGGHAFAAILWGLFTYHLVSCNDTYLKDAHNKEGAKHTQRTEEVMVLNGKWYKPLKLFIVFTTINLAIARLFSGAHWPSDVMFSGFTAYICYNLIILITYKATKILSLRHKLRSQNHHP